MGRSWIPAVKVDTSGLPPGNYSGKITITAPNAVNSPQVVAPQITPQAFSTLSGRVVTPNGNGLRNASVSLIDSLGGIRRTTTSSFGIFNFAGVPNGDTYTIRISSKRYRFTPVILQVTGNVSLPDFVGLE